MPNATIDLTRPGAVDSFNNLALVFGENPVQTKVSEYHSISSKTYSIYRTFPAALLKSVSLLNINAQNSFNLSFLDAFSNFGILSNVSIGEAQKFYLSYFGGASLAEVNSAAKELKGLAAVLDTGKADLDYGSYLLNYLFIGRGLGIKASETTLAATLKDCYNLDCYHDDPSLSNLDTYVKTKTPSDYFDPLLYPEGATSDETSLQALLGSSYGFERKYSGDLVDANYLGGVHSSTYQFYFRETNENVMTPYTYERRDSSLFENDDFLACETSLGTTFYQPKATDGA